jgi:hypothetical protein
MRRPPPAPDQESTDEVDQHPNLPAEVQDRRDHPGEHRAGWEFRPANIASIRKEVVGKFRVGGAIAGSGRKSLAVKVSALSAEVAELRRALTAAGIIGLGIAAQ